MITISLTDYIALCIATGIMLLQAYTTIAIVLTKHRRNKKNDRNN